MRNYLNVLRDCALFEGIANDNLMGMLGCLGATSMEVKKGQTVFAEGDSAVRVGIVLSGKLLQLREDYFGNRSIYGQILPSQLFGETYAFSRAGNLPVSVAAEEDSKLLLLDSRRITTCCSNACEFHNRVIFNLLRIVADKNLLLHRKLSVTSRRTTAERLLAYLSHCAREQGSNSFVIPFDRQALADYLEVDRSGLSTEIGKLKKQGILTCNKNHFTLL